MDLKQKRKIINKWVSNHGAAEFDLKSRDIIFFDGGLFSIEKKTKKVPRTRVLISKKPNERGNYPVKFIKVKGPKITQEDYKAYVWFEELEDTIQYLQSMKKMLNSIGYKTNFEYKKEFIEKFKKSKNETKNK